MVLISSDSSLETSSLIGLGADSTSSLASFKPNEVTSLTALITAILLANVLVEKTSAKDYELKAPRIGISSGVFSDNYFDLIPQEVITIYFIPKEKNMNTKYEY